MPDPAPRKPAREMTDEEVNGLVLSPCLCSGNYEDPCAACAAFDLSVARSEFGVARAGVRSMSRRLDAALAKEKV